jgi:hypothetical protein
MTRHSAFSSGNLVYTGGEDNRPHTVPSGQCEVEQRLADNSYIVRWDEHGESCAARFSAIEYFDLVRSDCMCKASAANKERP